MPGHRFSFENIAKLDDPRRLERQPPALLVSELGLRPGSLVLDLGVGTGYFALPIAARLEQLGGEGKVVGLDIEPRMLAEFVRRAEDAGVADRVRTVHLSGSNGAPFPVEDGSVDIALMGFVYHEFDNPKEYLKKVLGALRPGGRLFVTDWFPDRNLDFGPPAGHRVPPHQVWADMEEAGFVQVEPLSVYDGFYVMVGRRT